MSLSLLSAHHVACLVSLDPYHLGYDFSTPYFPKYHSAQKINDFNNHGIQAGLLLVCLVIRIRLHQPCDYHCILCFLLNQMVKPWSDGYIWPSSLRILLSPSEECIRVFNHPGWPENLPDLAPKAPCPRVPLVLVHGGGYSPFWFISRRRNVHLGCIHSFN